MAGGIAYAAPHEMTEGVPALVQAELSRDPNDSALGKGLTAKAPVMRASIPVSTNMTLSLTADDTSAFRIEALHADSTQLVLSAAQRERTMAGLPRWTWRVTPVRIRFGTSTDTLRLQASAYLADENGSRLPGSAPVLKQVAMIAVPVRVNYRYVAAYVGLSAWTWADAHMSFLVPSGAGAALIMWLVGKLRRQRPRSPARHRR